WRLCAANYYCSTQHGNSQGNTIHLYSPVIEWRDAISLPFVLLPDALGESGVLIPQGVLEASQDHLITVRYTSGRRGVLQQ
ncbi:MAG: hypothetical protein J0I90_03860, partial [Nitrosospira sp.]|nr:hypothetical protein [Nitrosospira sp.]